MLWWVLNGNVGVIRTAIGEIAPRRRHQALAMSTMSLLWQSGCVVGPMLGGSLADPIKNHPGWFSSDKDGFWKILFTKRPFLLPNIATSLLLVSGTILAFCFWKRVTKTSSLEICVIRSLPWRRSY